jgi:hypothetical protein
MSIHRIAYLNLNRNVVIDEVPFFPLENTHRYTFREPAFVLNIFDEPTLGDFVEVDFVRTFPEHLFKDIYENATHLIADEHFRKATLKTSY